MRPLQLYLIAVLCSVVSSRRLPLLATILPSFGANREDPNATDVGDNAGVVPPPPPPPLPAFGDSAEIEEPGAQTLPQQAYPAVGYPDESQFWAPGPQDVGYSGLPPPPLGWTNPPNDNEWYPQQHHLSFEEREHGLMMEIHNLTSTLAQLNQQKDLTQMQLDMMTERVMDAESAAAMERNSLIEYQANCTELGKINAVQSEEIQEWTRKCEEQSQQHGLDLQDIELLKERLKERSREAEDLAAMVETSRLKNEREKYLGDRKKKRKKRGFFGWVFQALLPSDDDYDESPEDVQEYARSTLLRALQTERDSVHELETALATLQQNNSAIAEMVESRDMLIDELNDRIAVFEEDKLVLKAALRQLQKEMKEEAPKTLKLVEDLKDARENIQKLQTEMGSNQEVHRHDVSLLQEIITQKNAAINETESNMTVIGTYVDRLEERLASFAIARREIDLREVKCQGIEERTLELELECDDIKSQLKEFEVEHVDLKSLLEDLVVERTELQGQKKSLTNERDSLLREGQSLRDTMATLETDVDDLGQVVSGWKARVSELEKFVEEQKCQLGESMNREAALQRQMEEQQAQEQARLEMETERAKQQQMEQVQHRETELAIQRELEQAKQREAEHIKQLAALAEQREAELSKQREVEPARKRDAAQAKEREIASSRELPAVMDESSDTDDEEDESDEPMTLNQGSGKTQPPPPPLPPKTEKSLQTEFFDAVSELPSDDETDAEAVDDVPSLKESLKNVSATLPHILQERQRPPNPPPAARKAPFRQLRKAVSRRTGLHGFFSKSSHQLGARKDNAAMPPGVMELSREGRSMDQSRRRPPPRASQSGLFREARKAVARKTGFHGFFSKGRSKEPAQPKSVPPSELLRMSREGRPVNNTKPELPQQGPAQAQNSRRNVLPGGYKGNRK